MTEMAETTRPPTTQCSYWIGAESRYCRSAEGVRHYLPGRRCPLHTPARLRGEPEPEPGPGWPIFRQHAEEQGQL